MRGDPIWSTACTHSVQVAYRQRFDLRRGQETLEIGVALNFETCFTPIESLKSNGAAEAFVKTFKRDYVRVDPLHDAATAIRRRCRLVSDRNEMIHPHSRLPYRSQREYTRDRSQRAACPV